VGAEVDEVVLTAVVVLIVEVDSTSVGSSLVDIIVIIAVSFAGISEVNCRADVVRVLSVVFAVEIGSIVVEAEVVAVDAEGVD
jgi:hypothetical protein